MSISPRRVIVGISGATGFIYGVRALEVLRDLDIETHLVVSRAAEMTRAYETELTREHLHSLAYRVYGINDVGASISSGSVAPCSVKTLAEIANGATTTLLSRAADVVLKERRRLVLMVREAPLHAGHIRNMLTATELGATIHPPVTAFYIKPESIDDIVNYTVGRALDSLGLEMPGLPRWKEPIT
jgi:flavin prenyltransferase